jgi:hypothetical protein
LIHVLLLTWPSWKRRFSATQIIRPVDAGAPQSRSIEMA